MTDVESYVARVRRGLRGMDSGLRADILAELENHLSDAVAEAGGDAAVALSGMQAPRELARHYREIYGYGLPFKALFVAVAVLVAVPTLTMPWMTEQQTVDPAWITAAFLLMASVYLIWLSVVAGKVVGAAGGAAACAARFATLGVLMAGGGTLEDGAGLGPAGFVLISLALILVGYLPGERKEKWKRGEVTL